MQTTHPDSTPIDLDPPHTPDPASVLKAIRRRSFAAIATTSAAGRPHAAGVLYAFADDALHISTMRSSRKARNIATVPEVGVTIPIRRIPVGPPSTVHFQSRAEVLAVDDDHVRALVERGELTTITGHGELELPDGCFLRIPLPRRLLTYGLGMSLRTLIADPLSAGGVVSLDE